MPASSAPSPRSGLQTIDSACDELAADVQAFREHWKRCSAANPLVYPEALNPGDWFEQFMAFVTSPRGTAV